MIGFSKTNNQLNAPDQAMGGGAFGFIIFHSLKHFYFLSISSIIVGKLVQLYSEKTFTRAPIF